MDLVRIGWYREMWLLGRESTGSLFSEGRFEELNLRCYILRVKFGRDCLCKCEYFVNHLGLKCEKVQVIWENLVQVQAK